MVESGMMGFIAIVHQFLKSVLEKVATEAIVLLDLLIGKQYGIGRLCSKQLDSDNTYILYSDV